MSKHSYEAWRSADLFDKGIGHVVVFRVKSNGDITAGAFLVDTYCLGVKDGFLLRFGASDREDILQRIFQDSEPQPISPGCAKKLVAEAVAYAQKLGLQPHPDYQRAFTLLNGIDAKSCDTTFEFGKDGKPLYIQGPNESSATAGRILKKLQERCGVGKYDFMVLGGEEDVANSDFVENQEEGSSRT